MTASGHAIIRGLSELRNDDRFPTIEAWGGLDSLRGIFMNGATLSQPDIFNRGNCNTFHSHDVATRAEY